MSPKSAPYRLKVGEGVACDCCCDGGLRRCTGVAGARPGCGCCLVLALLARCAKVGIGGGDAGAAPLIFDLLSLSSSCSCSFDTSLSVKESLASTALMSGTETSWSSHDDEDDTAAVAWSVEADGGTAGAGGGGCMASSAMVG